LSIEIGPVGCSPGGVDGGAVKVFGPSVSGCGTVFGAGSAAAFFGAGFGFCLLMVDNLLSSIQSLCHHHFFIGQCMAMILPFVSIGHPQRWHTSIPGRKALQLVPFGPLVLQIFKRCL
jgi:hypothetical protein